MTYYFVIPGVISLVSAVIFALTWKRFSALAILAIVTFGFSGFIGLFFLVEPLTKYLFE